MNNPEKSREEILAYLNELINSLNEGREKRQAEQREKVLTELLEFVDTCRPSFYTQWRDCEKAEMLKILEKL